MSQSTPPRLSLAHLPTPLEELPRLTRCLGGPRLLVKRDDQTGLALGGNKARKLEFLLAEALAGQADTLLTGGAAQSNHCRQTAAAAAKAGLCCELVLGGRRPAQPAGNVLLDDLLGAQIHWAGAERHGERLAQRAEALRAQGRRPYIIPYGGSNATGALGYVWAMEELQQQLADRNERVDHLIIASSSGGTQAGLVVGAKHFGFTGKILGIRIDKDLPGTAPYPEALLALGQATAAKLGWDMALGPADFALQADYLGAGYGRVNHLEREAIRLMAEQEGILLDPVYTGRALGGLVDLIRRQVFRPDETVLFWHTGGTPALFAYAADLFSE